MENNEDFYCRSEPHIDKCEKMGISKIKQFTQHLKRTLLINIQDFKARVIEHLRLILRRIDATKNQKEFIFSKSQEVLDELISRAETRKITIPKNTTPTNIAATIIYTIIISKEGMPKIGSSKISDIAGVSDNLNRTYKKYFKHLYQRVDSKFPYGFKKITPIISLYFFHHLIKDNNVEASRLVSHLRETIKKEDLLRLITKDELNTLESMAKQQHQQTFNKYFTDLAEVVRYLIILSIVPKKIKGFLVIKEVVKFLEEKGINLLQSSEKFYRAVIGIFNFLNDNSDFFPARAKRIRQDDYEKILGMRIKLYAIKNIYNGKYVNDINDRCSMCAKEGLNINSSVSRLYSSEFHHSTKKEYEFSTRDLYLRYLKNRTNPNFLEELIDLMESEKVELLCRSHHFMKQDKYFRYFKYLINWEGIFSLTPEEIHILIYTSVNNYYKTRGKTMKEKEWVRRKIVRYIKKRYFIGNLHGEYCQICGEFSIKKHLPAFICNHLSSQSKSINPSDLYDNNLPCSKIYELLKDEKTGYICANCHTIYHADRYIDILDEIFKDKDISKEIVRDYTNTREKFRCISDSFTNLIGDPLAKSIRIQEHFEKYLTATYELSKSGIVVTNIGLADYLGVHRSRPSQFFRDHSFMRRYVDIVSGKGGITGYTKYCLTVKGKNFVSLLFHFRDYYRTL